MKQIEKLRHRGQNRDARLLQSLEDFRALQRVGENDLPAEIKRHQDIDDRCQHMLKRQQAQQGIVFIRVDGAENAFEFADDIGMA